MKVNDMTVKLAGEAGAGVATIGTMLAKLAQRSGLYVFAHNDYPSLIRGGHNTMTVRINKQKIHSLCGKIDLLVALNETAVLMHAKEMSKYGVIIYDSNKSLKETAKELQDVKMIAIPMSKIAQTHKDQLYLNQVAMGAVVSIIGLKMQVLEELIKETLGSKGEEIVKRNISAAKAGYDYVKNNSNNKFDIKIEPQKSKKTILLNASDALCIGAIKAGVKFVAEYPMSPSSSILHWMAEHAIKYNIVVKHTEDEIAAMNYVLGAGFAGVRAMTATSGGGFSLMTEALGNGGIAEIACVVVNVQRAGPSTGLPTYTEQADLQFSIHASQGEFPRIVCMPADAQEAFYETFNVWNMAEQVQTPAIILLDKYIGEAFETVEKFDYEKLEVKRGLLQTDEQMQACTKFFRYENTKNGISPRCIPGQINGIHVTSSYEHDETGYSCEDGQNRIEQIDKRARKLKVINPNLYQPAFYGNQKSTLLAVCWGSTKGVALEALKVLEKENISARLMHIKYAIPFATDTIKQALQSASKVIIFEANSQGQMRNYIREKTGILIENAYLRYDARPFEVEEIANKLRNLANEE